MNTPTPPASGERRSAIAAHNLTRVFPARRAASARVALENVSFTVGRGEWVALLGPNGSGKSTLLRILATIDLPDGAGQSRLELLGRPIPQAMREARASLGVVFQRPGLDALLTVRENLQLQGALLALSRAHCAAAIERLATELGIADRLQDRVGALSGGLARRVDLARALLGSPELLLLDEPTTGLDIDARMTFLACLERERARRPELTIVMTTHLMDEAERAARVLMLHEGRIVADAPPSELRASLGERSVRAPTERRAILERAGLSVRTAGSRIAVGAGDPTAVSAAANDLLATDAAFEVGPATLADVYLALTGRSLDADQEAAS